MATFLLLLPALYCHASQVVAPAFAGIRGASWPSPLITRLHPKFASPLAAYPAPGLAQLLFGSEQKSRSSCIAKATVYLLGRGGGGGGGGDGLDDPGGLGKCLCVAIYLRGLVLLT